MRPVRPVGKEEAGNPAQLIVPQRRMAENPRAVRPREATAAARIQCPANLPGDRQAANLEGGRTLRARKQEGPGTFRFRGQTWGWELATLSSQSHTLGALAFAGRVLPDATLRGKRRFQSHGGTVQAVASRNLSSEASSPGSAVACQQQSRRTGCRHACNLRRSRRHRYHGVGPGFWPGVSPMLRV